MKYKITEWINEDELTEDKMYDILYPLSIVNFVRLFPKKFEPIDDCPASECDGEECSCEMFPGTLDALNNIGKPKEPNESLEENKYEQAWKSEGGYWHIFKAGVPFAGDAFVEEFNKMKKEREGMVSIDEVLRVFDKCAGYDVKDMPDFKVYRAVADLRLAIEKLGEK